MGKLLVIRHGETALNAQGILQGPRVDAPLNERGLVQARLLATRLRDEGLDALYTSPLQRARQTAQAVVDAVGGHLEARILPDLYELDYGEFSGRPKTEVADAVSQVLDAWKMGFPDASFPSGESAVVAQQRIRPTIERLVAHARDATIAVVAHGHINRIFIATALGTGLAAIDDYPQDNAAVTVLEVTETPKLALLNDASHLRLQEPSDDSTP